MAHNLTPGQLQRRRFAERAEDWRTWHVHARCYGGHTGSWAMGAILAMARPPATLGEVRTRMRCRQCGQGAEGLALRRGESWVPICLPSHMQPEAGLHGAAKAEWWRGFGGG